MTGETLIQELGEDGVLVLTLNRPRQKNAFNDRMYLALRDALGGALENDEVRCAIVTGAGGVFSAGQDLGEMSGRTDSRTGERGFPALMDVLVDFDKPLVAAVEGSASASV